MSRHEGVSCDSCLKGNFRGRRYKCLICYDYDLCGTCYECGATTARHTTDHPMQCILTRTDFDLYYGGEALSADQPQSFTCPYCSKMGLTEIVLLDHVTAEHADAAADVVCPICAALPSGDPNYVTDDFTAHLTLEHRAPRELEEPMGGIRHVRRIPHPGRGVGGPRTRRSNMHFQSSTGNALSGLAPNSRETMDPIAELLSQLTSVRSRAAAAQSVSSQLQQLEMQLQSTRYRQQLERLPRRQGEASKSTANGSQAPVAMLDLIMKSNNNKSVPGSSSNNRSQFLLSRYSDTDLSESERQELEIERADRSAFVQELLLSSLTENLRLDSGDDSEDAVVTSDLMQAIACREPRNDHKDNDGSEREDHSGRLVQDLSHGSELHNGRSNDVILHAPSQHATLTSDLHGNMDNHGNMVRLNIDGASEIGKPVDRGSVSPPLMRGSVSPPPPVGRGSPPPQNSH